MKPTQTIPIESTRNRQIGRKALKADNLARVLASPARPLKKSWRLSSLRPKTIATLVVVIILAAGGLSAVHMYSIQAETTKKTAAVKQQNLTKEKRLAAAACRQKKADEKADQIGKLTYDQLYDNNECDK